MGNKSLRFVEEKNSITETKEEKREIDVIPQKGIRSTSIQKYIVFVLKYQF